ncbi:MAG: tRNA (5-methylaminomethyl-2-thiouridylate)-methyltransferase [Gammaproteobacteria bacterium]|nr:tRNA (5-methylaminomethyl-2-thiouridylate)-methyltransferase [Gammaproteobacteria bacterium]MDH3534119.1 tRNA (5-methylaminomethyl-2-thiouridylate)-methyltransferase [Gammaproteobacteria bacterium]
MARKAVALISGGLDSLLATRLIQQQGIQVEGINFFTGFCVEGHTHAIRNRDQRRARRNNALWVAEQLGIRLHIIDIVDEYKQVVINPKHGYGANLNPCLDCKIFMVHKAHQWIIENGFDFIITGEVIGQRPKSQRRRYMPVISEESGADDLLLRPLCARNLPETRPERERWVEREGLKDFQGRSRKPQIALAREFGFEDYAQPAGGCCFLTDQTYSVKLRDLWDNRGRREYELDDIMLLKVGRHIRPSRKYKLIIAREEGENHFLSGYRHQFQTIRTVSHPGPLALVEGEPLDPAQLELACAITARFSKGRDAESVELRFSDREQSSRSVRVKPLRAEQISRDWVIA